MNGLSIQSANQLVSQSININGDNDDDDDRSASECWGEKEWLKMPRFAAEIDENLEKLGNSNLSDRNWSIWYSQQRLRKH